MSIFTSLVTKVLEVPGEPGQTITIRKLAPKHLEAAQKAQQRAVSADLVEMGGATFIQELAAAIGTDATKTVAQATQRDPVLLFHVPTLIVHGVSAWTYNVAADLAHVEDLDSETQAWLATEILRLSKPGLFQTAEEQDVDRKNG